MFNKDKAIDNIIGDLFNNNQTIDNTVSDLFDKGLNYKNLFDKLSDISNGIPDSDYYDYEDEYDKTIKNIILEMTIKALIKEAEWNRDHENYIRLMVVPMVDEIRNSENINKVGLIVPYTIHLSGPGAKEFYNIYKDKIERGDLLND